MGTRCRRNTGDSRYFFLPIEILDDDFDPVFIGLAHAGQVFASQPGKGVHLPKSIGGDAVLVGGPALVGLLGEHAILVLLSHFNEVQDAGLPFV